MKLSFVPNAGRILAHSFSMHCTYWGLGVLLAAVLVPQLWGFHLIHPTAMLLFSIIFLALTPLGRVIKQEDVSGPYPRPRILKSLAWSFFAAIIALVICSKTAGADARIELAMAAPPQAVETDAQGITWEATAALAVPLVARWEGLRTTAYLDTIASPPVWTVCYGETQNVTPGEVRTEAECQAGLDRGLERYWRAWMNGAVTEETALTRLPPPRSAAFASFAWNVGVGAASRSTATRRLNSGDIAGACEAMTWFNQAGGIVIRGLVNRRSEEREFCMRGA